MQCNLQRSLQHVNQLWAAGVWPIQESNVVGNAVDLNKLCLNLIQSWIQCVETTTLSWWLLIPVAEKKTPQSSVLRPFVCCTGIFNFMLIFRPTNQKQLFGCLDRSCQNLCRELSVLHGNVLQLTDAVEAAIQQMGAHHRHCTQTNSAR